MSTLNSRLPLFVGTAALALLLPACGANEFGAQGGPGEYTPLSPTSASTPSTSPSASASASPSASTSPSPSTSATPGTGGRDEADLEVEDQRGDGRTVAVEEASAASGTGFVAVYTRDDQLLGSAAVTGGPLTVELDERVPATGQLRAVLFGDDGDGTFSPETDPRLSANGAPVDEAFDYTLN